MMEYYYNKNIQQETEVNSERYVKKAQKRLHTQVKTGKRKTEYRKEICYREGTGSGIICGAFSPMIIGIEMGACAYGDET